MMKALLTVSVLMMALFISSSAISSSSGSMQCGARLASIGDTKSEVLYKCGAPTWSDSWEEDRVEKVFGFPYSGKSKELGTRIPLYTVVRVVIEEWIYNLGPNRFMRILTFEKNRLVQIETGNYGY